MTLMTDTFAAASSLRVLRFCGAASVRVMTCYTQVRQLILATLFPSGYTHAMEDEGFMCGHSKYHRRVETKNKPS